MSNLFYYFVEIYYLSATTATVRTMYTILNLSHLGMDYCFSDFTLAPHETLTEADKSISHPLIALLVDLLGLTAEAPHFSQRPNNISVQATP